MLKECSVCHEIKETTEFRKATKEKSGLQSQCKACANEKRRKWMIENPGKAAEQSRALRAADPDKHNASTRKWRAENPDKVKALHIKKRYGLTLEQWQAMYDAQAGRCKVCDKHRDETNHDLAVDHDHVTGKARGLLCVTCNRAIGLLQDSPDLLRKAASYLEVTRLPV